MNETIEQNDSRVKIISFAEFAPLRKTFHSASVKIKPLFTLKNNPLEENKAILFRKKQSSFCNVIIFTLFAVIILLVNFFSQSNLPSNDHPCLINISRR